MSGNYELALDIFIIKGKNISFSSSILLRFLPYVLFIVLEYEALVDELRDNFETINTGKKVLNCLTFRQRQSICICATSLWAVFNLAGNGLSSLLVKADIRFIDINTFNYPTFIWKFFTFGSVGNDDITFPTLFYSIKTFLGDASHGRSSFD